MRYSLGDFMEGFKYSIVIPHRNSEATLRRCLGSIPSRDDVQVIVSDDCSDIPIDWRRLEQDFPNVEVLLSDKCRGAGNARNRGMEVAVGKWLLFADADDFYADGFLDVLDGYAVRCLDVLYFNARSVDSKCLKNAGLTDALNEYIESYVKYGACEDGVRYRYRAPWFKMFRRAFLLQYNICFEEVIKGNDIMFSFLASYFAKRFEIISDVLYVYTYSPLSVSHKQSDYRVALCIFENVLKCNSFYEFVGHREWLRNPLKAAIRSLCDAGAVDWLWFAALFPVRFFSMYAQRRKYVEMAKRGA